MNEEQLNEEFENEIETPDDDSLEVEIVDDTPEQDRGRPRRADDKEPEIPEDDELANYSENVQSRIKKLRFEYHEERRRKEEAERIREEAITRAKNLYEENQKLKETLTKGESMLIDQAKTRIDSEINQAKVAYRNAYESGDTDAILEAQEKLTALQTEKYKVSDYKPVEYKPEPEPEFFKQTPRVPEPDAKAKAWAERNTWFQQDPEMTAYAFGVHEKLVKNGIDPTSDEYYAQIDENIRKRFPENFGDSHQRKPSTVVAPAGRSSKSPRKITLTQTQVALAKRLGLSPEQYAAQLLKESR